MKLDCPSSCTSCTNSTNCLTCKTNYYFHNYKCVSTCPAKTFGLTPPFICTGKIFLLKPLFHLVIDCISTCATCDASKSCLTCKNPYVEDVQVSTVCTTAPSSSNNNDPLNSCKSKEFFLFEKETDFLLGTIAGCDACVNPTTCLYCVAGQYLYNNICYSLCPSKTFARDFACYSINFSQPFCLKKII